MNLLEIIFGDWGYRTPQPNRIGTERRRAREKAQAAARVALYAGEPKPRPPSRQVIRNMAIDMSRKVAAPRSSWRRQFLTELAKLKAALIPKPTAGATP